MPLRDNYNAIALPRLMQSLKSILTNVLRIVTVQISNDPSTNEEIKTYNYLPNIGPISCYLEPQNASEQRTPQQTVVNGSYVAMLPTFIPQITRQMQVEIDLVMYDVLDIATDHTRSCMFLGLERRNLTNG